MRSVGISVVLAILLVPIGAILGAMLSVALGILLAAVTGDDGAGYLISGMMLLTVPSGIAAGLALTIHIAKSLDQDGRSPDDARPILTDAGQEPPSSDVAFTADKIESFKRGVDDRCSSCGSSVTFAAHQFGTLQPCPNCGKDMDVGASVWQA